MMERTKETNPDPTIVTFGMLSFYRKQNSVQSEISLYSIQTLKTQYYEEQTEQDGLLIDSDIRHS